ncbi:biotin--[acetyl-CoA-carboxylase] ligase [Psychrobacter frigidicola]|uniref:Biotin--[acetyl-CoA-carboxylase] ligase n=1 Tax=Psychrobacter frigidicola TaxID=45611 RepID=A0A5C7A8L4_9GAMM|nr:biotin--[acetyl-CoA-carboxylase] ligase [Psychrobacter frigidicola]TXD97090.1 biotin--[acetyl-CoA-carboxylase] ligase [Psychrobacter frigidicola]
MPLPARLPILNHRHVISSASTNSELIEAIKDSSLSADKVHLLTAETQTAGRGQRERSWQSPPGNVYLSLYHPVQMPVSGLLSLVIGVELAKMPIIQTLNEQLRAQGLPPIGVKWANDLGFYAPPSQFKDNVGTEDSDANIIYFSKLAGILIEPVWHASKLVGVVMGVGLNVKTTPTLTSQTCEGMSYQALSLQNIAETLKEKTDADTQISLPSLQQLYQQTSHALIDAISCFEHLAKEKKSIQTQNTDDFMQQFDSMDALSGLRLRVTQNHNGEPHITTGYACGIDTHGCLQLRQDNGKLAALFTGRIDVISDT